MQEVKANCFAKQVRRPVKVTGATSFSDEARLRLFKGASTQCERVFTQQPRTAVNIAVLP